MTSRSRVVGAAAKARQPTRPGIAQGINLITSTRKHSVTASGKTAPVKGTTAKHAHRTGTTKTRKRGWSPGWDAPVCVAEAVGLLLGLSAAEVLELDAAADRTIPGVLRAAGSRVPAIQRITTEQDFPRTRPTEYRCDLILGVALPEPHAIAVADGAWWSWGEPFDPADWPDMVVEEAWQVTL